ncbi:LOW QUALITY PROTEIN: integrator complex subunit 9-like [Uloborus diversus]|uniref:LOW QUALITY PROTEIN: integrator complex subunit 9-like n=1 Tax=Uloborus diversus TaxID=327109 RepID=UPI0024097175|nr:LOW QUALITY PROTEIN: integrator complex subunit 9-like [Uloborus diversus]
MKLYCLSAHPNKPCNILTFKGTTIMLDCGLDMTSALMFLPLPLVYSSRLFNLPSWTPRNTSDPQIEGELKECSGRVFVDSCPEFCPPEEHIVDFSQVDVILISNYQSMLALPYITEGTGFHGVVYATEPTLQIGRQFMEELVTLIERTPKIRAATRWKQAHVVKNLLPPLSEALKPRSWKQVYSMKEVNSSLSKVQVVGFSQKLDVFGALKISAVSSGYCLGSCNWIIWTAHEKIGYISASSTLTTHPKPMEHSHLKNFNALILNSLTQTPLANPDNMLGDLCVTVAVTVRNGGTFLLPCYPSGVAFDLFECLSVHLESSGSLQVPMFFLSPVAENSLAYSNILADWVTQSKQCKVYTPEEPFPHAHLLKGGRLKAFSSLKDESFSQEFRSPCVVFAGHPSLRFGDCVHFMELWGSNSNNVIIFTEPDFPHMEALAPYQPLEMKVVYYPIDTSLSFNQANKLIRELRPSHLLLPEQYTVPSPLNRHRPDQSLTIEAECNIIPFKRGDIVKVPIKRKWEHLNMSAELADKLMPVECKPNVFIATITGSVNVKDNKFDLKVLKEDPEAVGLKKKLALSDHCLPSSYACDSLDITQFLQKLNKEGITDAKVEERPSGFIIDLQSHDILIQVEDHSTHVICDGDSAIRSKLHDLILECLNKI